MDATEFQDLGELKSTLFLGEQEVDTATIHPDESHADAMESLREFLEEYYGESLEQVADDPLVTEVTFYSDDVPEIKYVAQ